MTDTPDIAKSDANKVAENAIKELDVSNKDDEATKEVVSLMNVPTNTPLKSNFNQSPAKLNDNTSPSKSNGKTSPTKSNSNKNELLANIESALAELADTNKNDNDEDIIEEVGVVKKTGSPKRDKIQADKSDDDIIVEVVVPNKNDSNKEDKKAAEIKDDDDDIIAESEVTRKKVFGKAENKDEAKTESDVVEEIATVEKDASGKVESKKRKKGDGDASDDDGIEVIGDDSSTKNEKKQIKVEKAEDIEVVDDGETSKPECSKKKRAGQNNGECNCENAIKWKQRNKELDVLKKLLTQQQQTLQSQQLLQQQQHIQQKEFLKQQGEFMKNQKLTMENMDKLLQVLANNAAVWSGLGDAMTPSEQIKQENIKQEGIKKEANADGTGTPTVGDDEVAILPTPPKIIETVDLDEADGKDGKNKKDYYNVYRGQEIHDRMPTAEEKRIQEEVTKLLKG